MIIKLARVDNIAVKDARTLNYAQALSLAAYGREKNSNFLAKYGIRQGIMAR
jgi:hypothetical protein